MDKFAIIYCTGGEVGDAIPDITKQVLAARSISPARFGWGIYNWGEKIVLYVGAVTRQVETARILAKEHDKIGIGKQIGKISTSPRSQIALQATITFDLNEMNENTLRILVKDRGTILCIDTETCRGEISGGKILPRDFCLDSSEFTLLFVGLLPETAERMSQEIPEMVVAFLSPISRGLIAKEPIPEQWARIDVSQDGVVMQRLLFGFSPSVFSVVTSDKKGKTKRGLFVPDDLLQDVVDISNTEIQTVAYAVQKAVLEQRRCTFVRGQVDTDVIPEDFLRLLKNKSGV